MLIERNLDKYILRKDLSLKKALKHLNNMRTRFIVCVSAEGKLVGTLTFGDINRWLINSKVSATEEAASDVCNRKPFFIQEDEDITKYQSQLKKFSYIPIVNCYGQLKGVLVERQAKSPIFIGDSKIGEREDAYVIAEIGNNHNGDLNLAKKLIDLAKDSGANCAKFQMRNLSELYKDMSAKGSEDNLGSQYTRDLLEKFQLSNDELFEAFDHCKNIGIQPLCTPWEEKSLALLESYGMPAYKISSADLTNHSFLERFCETGKPLICSTGMSFEPEITETVNLFQSYGSEYILLHCNSTYPSPFKDIHLNYLEKLEGIGSCLVGYSGHERDIFIAIAAVAKGARVIEKHFTIDRSMEGNDHKISLLPDEFSKMVIGIRQVEQALGNSTERKVSQGEMMNRVTLAKSIYTKVDIEKGLVITKNMLDVKGPGNGLQPNMLKNLIGKKSIRTLKKGDVFYRTDIVAKMASPKNYNFRSTWGLPVRHHDYLTLHKLSNAKILEFHLSYKDLELDIDEYFSDKINAKLVVHAPELFREDHTLDLTSPKPDYRQKSIREMKKVIDFTLKIKKFFASSSRPIGIITNVGGYTFDGPMKKEEKFNRLENLKDSLEKLEQNEIEILPQTMPPYPWHFGGQRYHNIFVEKKDITKFCSENKMKICLDLSHSKLACNFLALPFEDFLQDVLPFTRHIHFADAKGTDGEGIQIGEGDIDFQKISELLSNYRKQISWVPEIWQGHENDGEGFWVALNKLEEFNF